MLAQPIAARTYFYLRDRATKKLIPLTRAAESIGRAGATLSFPEDRKLSRMHCRIHRDQSGLSVTDMNSRNRTYVNEEPLAARGRRVLKRGDLLRVGNQSFEVVVEEFKPVAVATSSPPPVPPSLKNVSAERVLELSIPAKPQGELGLPRPPLPRLPRFSLPLPRGIAARASDRAPHVEGNRESLLVLAWIAVFAAISLARREFSPATLAAESSIPQTVFLEVFMPLLFLGLSLRGETRMRVLLATVVSVAWIFLAR